MDAPVSLLPVLAYLRSFRQAAPSEPTGPAPLDIGEIRERILAAMRDCDGPYLPRVRQCIVAARSVQELWQLRCEVHQVIAHAHAESEATRRLCALAPSFQGWVPERALSRALAVAA